MLKVFWEKYFRDRQEPTYTQPGKLAFTHALAEHITKREIALNETRESLAKKISKKKSVSPNQEDSKQNKQFPNLYI